MPDSTAQRALREVFEALADLHALAAAERDPDDADAIPWVRFDHDAQAVFDAWDFAFRSRLISADYPEAFDSHLTKYGSLMPSIALILHLAMDGRGAVTAAAARMAVRWCEYLESHAQRVYAMATCPERQVALPLLRRLMEWPKDEPIRVRTIRLKGWSGLGDNESIKAALDLLTESGWIQAIPLRPLSGRPTAEYLVHPNAAEFLKCLRRNTIETIETPSKGTFEGFDGSALAGFDIFKGADGRVCELFE